MTVQTTNSRHNPVSHISIHLHPTQYNVYILFETHNVKQYQQSLARAMPRDILPRRGLTQTTVSTSEPHEKSDLFISWYHETAAPVDSAGCGPYVLGICTNRGGFGSSGSAATGTLPMLLAVAAANSSPRIACGSTNPGHTCGNMSVKNPRALDCCAVGWRSMAAASCGCAGSTQAAAHH